MSSESNSENVTIALNYALNIIGSKYKWWHPGQEMIGDHGPFWAFNGPAPDAETVKNSVTVCTGVINLMRRKVGLTVPGVKENHTESAGGTYDWFQYLNSRGRLVPFDINQKYPKGTLLLSEWVDDSNQGHVAVIASEGASNVLYEKLLHSYSDEAYDANNFATISPGISLNPSVGWSHFWSAKGYYTHACLPENWLDVD